MSTHLIIEDDYDVALVRTALSFRIGDLRKTAARHKPGAEWSLKLKADADRLAAIADRLPPAKPGERIV